MQTVIDNVLLNYEILGNKKKNTILILHGWGRTKAEWFQTGKMLSDKYKVVLLDLPGFGGSLSMSKSSYDIYDYANLVNKFVKKLKINKLILLGHSFGGKISIVVASKNKTVQKLILVGSSGLKNKNRVLKIKKALLTILNTILSFLPIKTKDLLASFVRSKDYQNAGELTGTFKKVVKQHITSEAKKIKIPTIIIWGEYDREVTLAMAKKLKDLISNSHLRIVWGSGHSPHLEKADSFYKILRDYL